MAFCSNCGTQVAGRFCPNCGTDQSGAAGATQGSASYVPPAGPSTGLHSPGLTENVASALCYLFGVITGIIFLVVSPYNRNRTIRFHAFQSIFLFVAVIIIDIILTAGIMGMLHLWFLVGTLWAILRILFLVLWIYLMYSAYNNKKVKLPVIGDLAEKQA